MSTEVIPRLPSIVMSAGSEIRLSVRERETTSTPASSSGRRRDRNARLVVTINVFARSCLAQIFAVGGVLEFAIEHDSQWLPQCQLEWAIGYPSRQRGIILEYGADPDDHCIHLTPESMRVLSGERTSNPSRFSLRRGHLSIQCHPGFQNHIGTTGPHPVEVFAIQPRRLLLCDRRRHPDPGPAQGGDASSFDHGIGVSHRHHHPSHAGLNNCRHARWGSFEEVATGLERDIERRAFGMWPCLVERKNFRVGLPWTVMIPAADDRARP